MHNQSIKSDTSWQNVSRWYNRSVGLSGQYYQQRLVMPNSLKLLNLQPSSSLLDLACGQGILARNIPASTEYYGIDIAPSLIKFAQKNNRSKNHHFFTGDIARPLPFPKNNFTHVAIILALQNIEKGQQVIVNVAARLSEKGKLLIVLNHPCFRIPRQSSWEIDEKNKIQYRRINRYFSPLKIPINMHPGQKQETLTWSFHNPVSNYSFWLKENGFVIEEIQEWLSDKKSVGTAGKMENLARTQFPLFMAILARKSLK